MAEDRKLPLSSNPDLENGVLHIPADSKTLVTDLVKAREEGANVKVKEDGSVVITVSNTKED